MGIPIIDSIFNNDTSVSVDISFNREFIRLKRLVNQGNPSPRLRALVNEIEQFAEKGKLGLAKMRLQEAKEEAKKEGLVSPEQTGIPEPPIPETELQPEEQEGIQYEPFQQEPEVIRVYQDESDDIGASFQHPTPLNELEAPIQVASHERGHIYRAVGDALVHGKKIGRAYYTINWKVDYKRHKFYTTGGKATIKTKGSLVNLKTP